MIGGQLQLFQSYLSKPPHTTNTFIHIFSPHIFKQFIP